MQNRREVSCWRHCTTWYSSNEENQLRFSNSKHSHLQRNISFQNDISLKTMRLGVLSGEKLKNRKTHGRIVSLDQLGSWRAIADLFVMFIPWQVKKLQKFINVCLKVGYSANLKHSKSTRRQLIAPWKCAKFEQNHNIKSSGHNALLDRRTGMIDLRQLSFWYRAP